MYISIDRQQIEKKIKEREHNKIVIQHGFYKCIVLVFFIYHIVSGFSFEHGEEVIS